MQAPDDSADELPELLNAFLRSLDTTERRVFLRRYWLSVSPEDIAREEGTTKNAVTVRLYKTRGKLRTFLKERGYSL